MDDTEQYLNNILQRRLGSIPGRGFLSSKGNGITRLPQKQESLDSMPTVFRLKTEETIRVTGAMPNASQSKNPLLSAYTNKQPMMSKKRDDDRSQRVQYVAISKRIQGKISEPQSNIVDVSKYRKTTYKPPEQIKLDPKEFLQQEPRAKTQINLENIRHLSPTNLPMPNKRSTFRPPQNEGQMGHNNFDFRSNKDLDMRSNNDLDLRSTNSSQGRKRTKIFSLSKQKRDNN